MKNLLILHPNYPIAFIHYSVSASHFFLSIFD